MWQRCGSSLLLLSHEGRKRSEAKTCGGTGKDLAASEERIHKVVQSLRDWWAGMG